MSDQSEQRDVDFLLEFREFKGEVNTKLDRAIEDIKGLQHSFVTRDEHMTLRRVVHGDTGEGGLVKEVKDHRDFMKTALGVLLLAEFLFGVLLTLYVNGKL